MSSQVLKLKYPCMLTYSPTELKIKIEAEVGGGGFSSSFLVHFLFQDTHACAVRSHLPDNCGPMRAFPDTRSHCLRSIRTPCEGCILLTRGLEPLTDFPSLSHTSTRPHQVNLLGRILPNAVLKVYPSNVISSGDEV